jgi:uncharacterized protein
MNQIQFIQSRVTSSTSYGSIQKHWNNLKITFRRLHHSDFISLPERDQTSKSWWGSNRINCKLLKQFDEIGKRKKAFSKRLKNKDNFRRIKIEKSFDYKNRIYYLPYKRKKKTRADVARENS